MARATTDEQGTAARAAVLALYGALRSRWQHPEQPALWRPAWRRAAQALQQATAGRDLVLRLCAGSVSFGDHELLAFHDGEPPFGTLRAAGIGELLVRAELPSAQAELLLGLLVALPATTDPEQAWAAVVALDDLPAVQLRAVADLPPTATGNAGGELDWRALPQPRAIEPALRALVERDLSANLTALVLRRVFDDHDEHDLPIATTLERLLRRTLADGDFATASWLLDEATGRPSLVTDCLPRLFGLARRHCDAAWCEAALRRSTRDEALHLAALVLRLGDAPARTFAAAASALAHPVAGWLPAGLTPSPR